MILIFFSLNHPLKDADWVIYFPTDEPILLRGRQAGDTILVNGITKNSVAGLLTIKFHKKLDRRLLSSNNRIKYTEL